MGRLVYNEIKLFFSKKNIIVAIIGAILMVVSFQLSYIKAYDEYAESYQNKLQEEVDNATVWSARYTRRLERLLEEYPGHEAIPEAEMTAKVWKNNLYYLKYLQILWQRPEENKVEIKKAEKQMDDNLILIHDQNIETGITGLYRFDQRDWNNRILIRDSYENAKSEEPLIPIKPDGAYVLSNALSGTSIPYLIIIILMILWNYDIWSRDFENETTRLIFTLPYTKNQIYIARFITRFIMSLLGILICLFVLFLSGYIRFGSGLERWVIVNQKAVNTFGFFNVSGEQLLELDKVVSIKHFILLELAVFIPYVLMIYTFIQFFSFVSKNQMISMIVPIIGLVILLSYLLLPKETNIVGINIFLYMQSQELFLGALGIGLPLIVTLLFAVSLLLVGLSMMVLHRREQ